jgi:hypothetical protein
LGPEIGVDFPSDVYHGFFLGGHGKSILLCGMGGFGDDGGFLGDLPVGRFAIAQPGPGEGRVNPIMRKTGRRKIMPAGFDLFGFGLFSEYNVFSERRRSPS